VVSKIILWKPTNSKNKPKYKWLRMRQILILPTP
jgi:hypothetical protein